MFAALRSNICVIPANDVKCLRACAQRPAHVSWMSFGGSVLSQREIRQRDGGDPILILILYQGRQGCSSSLICFLITSDSGCCSTGTRWMTDGLMSMGS